MKKSILILIAALATINSYAVLIEPISALRSVSVSGTNSTESYAASVSSSGLGDFERAVSGIAGVVAPQVLWADSRARQTSIIEEDAISIAFNLQARTGAFAYGPIGPIETSTASSLFELHF